MENKEVNNNRLLVILGLIVAGMATRFIPHPPNATAIGAVALFSGAFLRNNKLAILVPIVAMLISDIAIFGMHSSIWAVYTSFILITLLGTTLANRKGALPILGASLASSILFFVLTNFAVWLGNGFYPQNFAGLVECYASAIPFFQNTLVGDLVFNTALFGSFYALQVYLPQLKAKNA